jgi:serine/threonine protein kinase
MSNSYVLEKLLGFGSSSFAYLASSPDGSRAVIKRMKDGDSESMHAMEREYGLLKFLSHPHIVRVVDTDASGHMSWMAVEHLEGSEDLSSRVKACGPLEPRIALTVLRNLTSAIEYIHERGVIHRDVKPDNVLLVGKDGDMRLFDFNAAHNDGTVECFSPVGDCVYRAPEVWSEIDAYGFKVDIWGIGATLYFALASAFKRRKLFQDAEWKAVPDALKHPLARCLEIEPARRPTAAVLLESIPDDVDVTAA